MAVYGDRVQALMDEFYTEWRKEENADKIKWDVLGGFSSAHQIAVVLGNFNYQVENGGISQWIYNGYFHDDAEKLTEFLEAGAESDERCRTILDRVYKLDGYARETECDRDGYFNEPGDEDGEDGFIGDMINGDAFDTWYYDKCDGDDWWQVVCGIIDKVEGRGIYVKAESVDLASFVYKVHALAGNYMSDAHFNVSTFASGSEHYLMLMSDKNIYLCVMGSAYRRDATANDIWFHQAVAPDTKAFLIHVTGQSGDRIHGSITELDHEAQRKDIIAHSIGCMHIEAKLIDGTERSYTPEQWTALEPIDRVRVESWNRRYAMSDIADLTSHLNDLCERLESSATQTHPEAILEELNRAFTEQAVTGRPELFRIDHSAAKEITARGDALVYRLLPDKDELLTPLDAVRNGTSFANHYAFAIKRDDIDGFLKWAERSAGDIIRRTIKRDEREKPKSRDAEL